jgi:hypothetical protein
MSQISTLWPTVNQATPEGHLPEQTLGAGIEAVVATTAEIESLRGVSSAAADVAECTCPEPCERDHANE